MVGFDMNGGDHSDIIVSLLEDVGSSGCCGIDLQRFSGLPEDEFEKVSETFWNEGYLCGVREEICCGRGCRFMCISYMEMDRIWRLVEQGECCVSSQNE